MQERRSQTRIRDAELVMLGWDHDGTPLKQLGNVEDFSPGGMGIIVNNPVPIGTRVTITYGESDLTGIVRHESARREGNFIGIEFDPDSRDSDVHFDPELLVR